MGRRSRPAIDLDTRSDWGFFGCARALEKCEQDDSTAQILTFSTEGVGEESEGEDTETVETSAKTVTCVRPLSGEGTQLMHGGFARRMSPSGESLAWFILQNRDAFAGKRVLDLGSGLGLQGLAAAAWTDANCVELTDGDPTVVKTLERSIKKSAGVFGDTKICVKQLLWQMDG